MILVKISVCIAFLSVAYKILQRYKFGPNSSALWNDDSQRVTYVIGDLHGDVECAKFWVHDRLKLVDLGSGTWLQPHASLVFMGDYIDKGPMSLQTLEFVQSLTERFPEHVTALMGNHEMELLRDRDPRRTIKYMQYPYATVHPEEYLNFVARERNVTDEDKLVVETLLDVGMEMYANRWHQYILYSPQSSPNGGYASITDLIRDEKLRSVVQERLREYQAIYLRAFDPSTKLGRWVEALPVLHVENEVLFCHGGINERTVQTVTEVDGVDNLNKLVQSHSPSRFVHFIEQTDVGRAVYEMLVYRGNHDSSRCSDLIKWLDQLKVDKLAVGHTPDKNIRSSCSRRFWAVDSLLGRWIRTSGNYYCPKERRLSQNRKFVCDDLVPTCRGQIAKISSGKQAVTVLSA